MVAGGGYRSLEMDAYPEFAGFEGDMDPALDGALEDDDDESEDGDWQS